MHNYTFTPEIVRALMTIEATRQAVTMTTLPLPIAETLRQQARVRSTHYSTRIEGNRLTLDEAEQVVFWCCCIPDCECDMGEGRNYYRTKR